jgi:hypothetical protein
MVVYTACKQTAARHRAQRWAPSKLHARSSRAAFSPNPVRLLRCSLFLKEAERLGVLAGKFAYWGAASM